MKKLQKIGLAVTLTLSASANVYAIDVVIDPAHIALQTASWAKQVADMYLQYTQLKATFDSMNGTRGIAGLLTNPQLYDYLPHDFASVLSADSSSGLVANNMMTTLKLYGIEQTGIDPNSATATLFKNGQNQNAVFRILGEQGYKVMNDRIQQLTALKDSIAGTTDPKSIAELQARIAVEQGFLANEQAKLNVIAQMQVAQDRIRQQQGREILMKSTKGPMPSGW